MCNGYYIVSELNDVLQSRYFESFLGYNIVDWFLEEISKRENKLTFHFKNTEKDTIKTKKDKDDFKK